MGFMTREQADALLAKGAISPDSHAMIVGPEPEPKLINMFGGSQLPPVSSMKGGFPSMAPPAAPPPGPGLQGALDHLSNVGPPPAPERPPVSVAAPELPVVPAPTREPTDFVRDPRPEPPARTGGGAAGPDPRKEMVGHEQEAIDKRIASQGEANEIEAMRRVELETAAKDKRDAAEQQFVLQQAQRQDEKSKIDAAVAQRQQAIDEYTSAKVDPDKFWKDRGPVKEALAALAVGIGAFVEGYSGGKVRNSAAALIEKSIDRDLRTQEIAVEQKGKKVGMVDNSIAQLRAIAGDNESARNAEKLRQITMWQDHIGATMQKYDSERARVNGAQVINDLEASKKELQDKLNLQLRQEAAARASAAAAAAHQARKEDRAYGLDVAKVRIDAQKAQNEAANKANPEAAKRAARDADLAVLDRAFEQASENIPMLGTSGLPSLTDSGKDYDAARAAIVSVAKGEGESSDADVDRVGRMAPLAGDSPAVRKRKHELLRAKVIAKHASPGVVADERARNPDTAVGFKPVQ